MRNEKVRILVEGALIVALGTVLSMIKIDMPLGGGVTLCSMLPLVLFSYRNGIKWGLGAAFVHSLIQMMLGLDNVQYATSMLMAVEIVLLDYLIAYTVLGLAGMFRGKLKSTRAEIAVGAALTVFVRFLCHFASGWMIWEVLWPNELGYAAPIWSLIYNGSYMGVELVITVITSVLLVPLVNYGKTRQ